MVAETIACAVAAVIATKTGDPVNQSGCCKNKSGALVVLSRDRDFIEIKTLQSAGSRGYEHKFTDALDRVRP